jgi:hypothetical protein
LRVSRNSQAARSILLRKDVAELLAAGLGVREIARRLRRAPSTISHHLAALQREWKQQAADDYQLWLGRQLALLAYAEAEAIEAWSRSKLNPRRIEITRLKGIGRRSRRDRRVKIDGQLVVVSRTVKLIESLGEAEYLNILMKCVRQRSRLLNLYPLNGAQEQAVDLSLTDVYDVVRSKLLTAISR